MMQKSKAYVNFLEQMNTTGVQKLKGYSSNLLQEIYEEERAEVEEVIWNAFHNGDCDVAKFLPQLKKYNGIEAMTNKIKECNVPSDNSLELAMILYNHTNEVKFMHIFEKNIELGSEAQRISALAKMLKCTPNESMYELFKTTYFNDTSSSVRSVAANGILYCKGFIKNPYDIKEMMNVMDYLKKMNEDDKINRKKIIIEMESK